ncbi:hypothetical protein Calab_2751 [Caldithrix abyssi DSM 13497]|uniref:Uncharacterized protein n=1 Tax=Caldithrix abyssi DSM 13497 TaxID=880073 RepID=H1XQT6_CALAY|nr:hypothetical protein [Caldithrix abyssi]APF18347.1 hypothetical protein Cabys_1598 [Caldithrix abyssi DSM 13497]EHO42359.1 hypothetical protein Calab_2751 [Caldithrix abyssi DSM 13497]
MKIRNTKKRTIIIFFVMVVLTPLVWFVGLKTLKASVAYRLRHGTPVELGQVKSRNGVTVTFIGMWGDVFNPKKYLETIQYDLVPITSGLEMLPMVNILCGQALRGSFYDLPTYKTMVTQLIFRLNQNRLDLEKIWGMHLESGEILEKPKEWKQPHALQPYIWRVPEESKFFQKREIRAFAALPVIANAFHFSDYIVRRTPKEHKEIVALNLRLALIGLLEELFKNQWGDIHSIGCPAFSADPSYSWKRYASKQVKYAFPFRESFFTIRDVFIDNKVPPSITRVYLVSWDKYETAKKGSYYYCPRCGDETIDGLATVYAEMRIFYNPLGDNNMPSKFSYWAISYLVIFALGVLMLYRYPSRSGPKNVQSQLEYLERVVALIGSIILVFFMPFVDNALHSSDEAFLVWNIGIASLLYLFSLLFAGRLSFNIKSRSTYKQK